MRSHATYARAMTSTRPRLPARNALVALSATSMGLLVVRWALAGYTSHLFMVWNLFLAWLPIGAAWAMRGLQQRETPAWALVLTGLAWLAFLPNAPYLVTDLVHLHRGAVPLWFDATMFGTFAVAGVALGLVSQVVVQQVVSDRWGALAGWLMSASVIPLCAVGIWLGRVHRFNSWDLLADPRPLVHVVLVRVHDPLGNPLMLALVGAMMACLAAGYALVWFALGGSRQRHTLCP